ncbi:MAG: hypothetical protein AVDCRST_MAG64-1500, partial [uncultured Phycisphaerae bacterium]
APLRLPHPLRRRAGHAVPAAAGDRDRRGRPGRPPRRPAADRHHHPALRGHPPGVPGGVLRLAQGPRRAGRGDRLPQLRRRGGRHRQVLRRVRRTVQVDRHVPGRPRLGRRRGPVRPAAQEAQGDGRGVPPAVRAAAGRDAGRVPDERRRRRRPVRPGRPLVRDRAGQLRDRLQQGRRPAPRRARAQDLGRPGRPAVPRVARAGRPDPQQLGQDHVHGDRREGDGRGVGRRPRGQGQARRPDGPAGVGREGGGQGRRGRPEGGRQRRLPAGDGPRLAAGHGADPPDLVQRPGVHGQQRVGPGDRRVGRRRGRHGDRLLRPDRGRVQRRVAGRVRRAGRGDDRQPGPDRGRPRGRAPGRGRPVRRVRPEHRRPAAVERPPRLPRRPAGHRPPPAADRPLRVRRRGVRVTALRRPREPVRGGRVVQHPQRPQADIRNPRRVDPGELPRPAGGAARNTGGRAGVPARGSAGPPARHVPVRSVRGGGAAEAVQRGQADRPAGAHAGVGGRVRERVRGAAGAGGV